MTGALLAKPGAELIPVPRYLTDDGFHDDPAVVRAGTAAVGLYFRCGVYVAKHLLDGHVPSEIASQYGTPEWIRRLTDVGLWETEPGGHYMPLYFEHGNLSRIQILSDRAKRTELRNPMILKAVRDRDGDWCRYCGRKVNWTDRRGTYGATYDHVLPGLLKGTENLVVACRSCNSSKRDRTPEEAGLTLLAPRTQVRPRSDLNRTRNPSGSDLTPSPLPSGERGPRARATREASAAPPPSAPPLAAGEHHQFNPGGPSGTCASCGYPRPNRRHKEAP
jgi:HNH endonuclease